MERYWVYIDSKVQGPVEIPALRKLPGFTLLTQVCAESNQNWRMADEVIEIKSYFAPPRASSLPSIDAGNTAPAIDPTVQPTMSSISLMEPMPVAARLNAAPAQDIETLPSLETPPNASEAAPSGSLRLVCGTCGYKNPRDVSVCMKCGTALKKPAAAAAVPRKESADASGQVLSLSMENIVGLSRQSAEKESLSTAAAHEPEPTEVKITPMVEIPMTRILVILGITTALSGLGFLGYRYYRLHHHAKVLAPAPAAPVASEPEPVTPRRSGRHALKHLPHKHYVLKKNLPGLAVPSTYRRKTESNSDTDGQNRDDQEPTPTPYRIIAEATPLKHRQSAPVDSPYAVKRRADKALWVSQSEPSVQQVQQYRIYGGLRTINRNTEILMQILRDREYNSAFESGKRLYLYNDMDWSATQLDGPLYEVHLTFSGGRESDGSAKKPLRFAFEADMERSTVEPGGSDQIRSNTMHAFFDESRIPPEDRRAIAKDTEELVLAAQPDGSPLALDTIARHFKATYGAGAMTRIATAYDLDALRKRLAHLPKLTDGSEATTTADVGSVFQEPVKPEPSTMSPPVAAAPAGKTSKLMSKSGTVDYQMENGNGRERILTARAASRASVKDLWEVVTGYDRLKQFVPNLITSDREGQDGNAIIVHTVSLTHFFVFVFRVNLHLRIIEHPQQHTIEFERIAGDFDQFRGSVEITPGEGGGASVMTFHATVVPQGRMPAWVMRDMAQRYLVPVLDAIRSKAESF